MKKIKYLVLIISLLFLNNLSADAYVLIDYGSNGNRITPVNKNITNVNSNWGYSGTAPDIHSPWLWSPSQFWYYGDAKGSYISVNADYYVGIKVEDYSDSSLNNYLGTSSNTLTSSNLRCAIGSAVGVGYDSTYIPTVSNFNVTYTRSNASNDFAYQYLYHITFNYHQQIKTIAKNNTNMSCWFERNPSSGLFAQGISGLYDASLYYYYYNSNFQYAVTEDPNTAILNDINSAMNETNDKLEEQINQNEEAEKTRKGIWETIKSLPGMFLDMLLGLFIPDNMDFLNDFVDVLEDKLGFIASVPIQLIEFITGLVSTSWETFDSVSLPSINIFGYNFWNAQEIDLTEAINIFKPFKYVTDVICVVICARTLNRWRETFSGGGSGE